MPFQIIIIAIILLVTLVVVIMFFTGRFGPLAKDIQSCYNRGGYCSTLKSCPDADKQIEGDCKENNACCIKELKI